MSVDLLRQSMQDYAKDIRLNLGAVLTPQGAGGLNEAQIWGAALACAYATRSPTLVEAVSTSAAAVLNAEEVDAAKAAATIMAMNNIYYRALHLVDDGELSKLPARLRMNVLAKSGLAKVDFELLALAVSALNGCGACVKSHIHEARKAGVADEGIQSLIRIAAVINAAAQAVFIG